MSIDIPRFIATVTGQVADSPIVWRVEAVESTGSTITDLVDRHRSGESIDGLALFAFNQTDGRGRLSRPWVAPPGSSIALSVGVPLPKDPSQWGLLPLMAGLGVCRAVTDLGVEAKLKWPNDVLVSDLKICGILVEAVGCSAVIGIGVNVCQTRENIGFPNAISLAMAGVETTMESVAAAVLSRLGESLSRLSMDDYRARCATLGQLIRVWVNDAEWVEGMCVDVADDGMLGVDLAGGVQYFAVGDVFHVRPSQ